MSNISVIGSKDGPAVDERELDVFLANRVSSNKAAAPYLAQTDPTGVVDSTTALNAAAAASYTANPNARLVIPAGTYKISGTVSIRCELDASQATFNYTGTGTALVIGSDASPGLVTPRRRFLLPRVINVSRGGVYWDSTSVGVKLVNLDTCHVYVPFVQDFSQGLVLYGYSAGIAYTQVHLGALWDNRKNLVLTNDATGWANDNKFYGGRLNQTIWKGAFNDDPDANQISMVSETAFGGPNNNTFVGTSIEGVNVSYYRLDASGKYNMFLNCRWENFGTPFRLRGRTGAQWNKLIGGYGLADITEILDGTLGAWEIQDGIGGYTRAVSTAAQVIPNNVYTAINTWNTPVSAKIAYNATTGEFTPRPGRWLITATVTFATNATGRRIARVTVGASPKDVAELPGNAVRSSLRLSTSYKFNGVETFKIECMQTSGGDLALDLSDPYVKIQAEYLGY